MDVAEIMNTIFKVSCISVPFLVIVLGAFVWLENRSARKLAIVSVVLGVVGLVVIGLLLKHTPS